MASIHYVGEGKAPYVQLEQKDRERLATAVSDYREQGGSMTELAKQLGINRTYLYTFFNVQRIELMRFASIQDSLGIQLLDASEIKCFLESLQSLLFIK